MSNTFSPPDRANLPRPVPARRDESIAAAFAASPAITALSGAAGLLGAGIGGRIAMRVVFVTSSDHVRGLTSDDGFAIGTISEATIFLLIFTTILGGIAGLGVGIVRPVTSGPTSAVAPGSAVARAAFGGGSIVHTDGVDFRFLDQLRVRRRYWGALGWAVLAGCTTLGTRGPVADIIAPT